MHICIPHRYLELYFFESDMQSICGLFTQVVSVRPGDYLKPGEDEIDGLKRRLDDRLAPPPNSQFDQATHGLNNDWEIGDCLAQWWRPNFETFMVLYRLLGSTRRLLNFHSILLSQRISQSQRSAKNSSWYRCPRRVCHFAFTEMVVLSPFIRGSCCSEEHETPCYSIIRAV